MAPDDGFQHTDDPVRNRIAGRDTKNLLGGSGVSGEARGHVRDRQPSDDIATSAHGVAGVGECRRDTGSMVERGLSRSFVERGRGGDGRGGRGPE
jgi:hypothetical protein